MTAETGAAPVATLNMLREQLSDTHAALGRHAALTQRRGLTLPPGALDLLATVSSEIGRLVEAMAGDDIELTQLRSLAATSALINSSLDVDKVLAQSMDELITLTGAERGFILLVNDQTNRLEFRISRGLKQGELHEDEVSRTILRDVLTKGEPVLTDNAMEDLRLSESETVAKFVLRSIMCVPLRSRGRGGSAERISGVIYVDNKFREAVFSQLELNLLTAFANQAVVAIENAVLFRQVQDTLQEISRARAIIENVFTSIDSGVITTDHTGVITLFNRAAGEIVNLPPDEAVGQPFHRLLPGLLSEVEAQLSEAQEVGRGATLEAEPDIAGRGRIRLNIRLSPIVTAAGETQGAAMVLDDLTAEREREETLMLMNRYLPPGMVDNIHQIADLAMGGERREITCAFMSACSYAAFPPGLRPQQIMDRLNIFLQTATEVIHRSQGIIDKYLGNEIMILFNTQLNPDAYHARRAVEMALAMRDAFADLAERLGDDPDQPGYTMAVHTGVATLGNVGSLRRRSFTAIGDTINLTKRIQENATAGQVLVTGQTAASLMNSATPVTHIRFEPRGTVQARGRQGRTELFEVFYA